MLMHDIPFSTILIMICLLPSFRFWVAMLEMGPFLWMYPLVKRFSWQPQAWLGLAVNVGFSLVWFQVNAALAPKAANSDIDLSFARALNELQDDAARSPQMPMVNSLIVLGTSWCVHSSQICATSHLRLLTSQLGDGLRHGIWLPGPVRRCFIRHILYFSPFWEVR